MARIIAALICGILLGILAMLAAGRLGPSNDQSPDTIVRDIADVPKMAQAVAEKHREQQYSDLTSVEEVVALPTEFARSEAMYALAGRSGSADVQNLIFEANRIADDVERNSLLTILFFRLTETDPQSALALARTDDFKGIRLIEQVVWRAWARKDLDDALFAAKTQTSVVDQKSAAQSLYAAFGYMGNETTERIETELGIAPDRSSRGRFLYQLADRSPAEAIAFINDLERGMEQQEYVSWLAYYVSTRNPTGALRYADLFRVASDGQRYSNIIKSNIARENPKAAIDRMLASGGGFTSSGELYSAVRSLASVDPDAARQYFEQAHSSEIRRAFGSAIAMELAKKDPAEALAWARANDKERFPYLQMSVLRQIAETNPQLALSEALNTPNAQVRSNMIGNVVQQIAQNDPASAVVYLDQIENQQQKLEASQQLVSTWAARDPDAAIDWVLSQDERTVTQLIQQVGHRLLDGNIDAAIRILPRLDEQNQQSMRQQIAQRLSRMRSPAEAQSFIRQFEGEPGYGQLQASVISGVAQTDVFVARQLADQLTDGNARDSAYMQVIARHAQTNPAEAARWLGNIADDNIRGTAAGQLAGEWYANDPVAATRWVTALPEGASRDDAIMQMSYRWSDTTTDQAELIASIGDRGKRGQAKLRQIYNIARTDPAKAKKLLDDEDISASQRRQLEDQIRRYNSRF